MNKRRERALEAFLFITFPIALFAGCTGLENTKNDVALSASDFEPVALGETMSGDGYVAQWDSPGFFRTVGIDDTVESSRMSQAKAADLNTSPAEREPLQSVFKFQTGEYRVRAADRKALLKHAQLLAANPGLLLSVIGYADRRGSASYNQTLSEKRAREVYT
jgi:peptidoglycan-associated lipoprotein